jgi:ATPase subunit of ABC transporter with duplicated ATPase domains
MLAKEIKFIERFKARASRAAQVQSRVKKLDKIDRSSRPSAARRCASSSSPRRSGEDVATLACTRAMAAGRSMRARLPDPRRERWCVMGVNGAGKSTLLKLVAGAEPDQGTVALGGA